MTDKLGPYLLGPNDENQGIYTGDARELAQAIPDESVDLIFTDPVYDRIDDYRWLAETAARVLKLDSACLVYYAIGLQPQIHLALIAGGLSYRWRLVTRTVWSNEFHGRLIVGTQEVLWYEKGHSKPLQSIFDLEMASMSGRGDYRRNGGNWGKHLGVACRYTETFLSSDGILVDFFGGSGTNAVACKMLSRKWMAFEIDPPTADLARKRVRETQPPLFVPQPEQMEMVMT